MGARYVMATFLLVQALSGDTAAAHGTGARVLGNTATTVELYYSGGDPMAYAEAKVFSPDSPNVPFVNGRADRRGRVTFAADRDGIWRIEAKDNEGHKVLTEVTIAAGSAAANQGSGGNRWLLWFSLFLNVLALATLAERWRNGRSAVSIGRAFNGGVQS